MQYNNKVIGKHECNFKYAAVCNKRKLHGSLTLKLRQSYDNRVINRMIF